ncbi:M20 family metallopeptidase [Cloacibacillus porcorum]
MQKLITAQIKHQAGMSIEICRELIKCPSEDPAGDTRAVASYIQKFFTKHGIENNVISPHPEKPNVVATIRGSRSGKHLIFNGHIDTFPVGDISKWSVDPFSGEIKDGKLYGRGAADMKGGIAASMTAALILNQLKDTLPGKISFTCVSDEEVNGPWGTNYLLKHYPELYGDALINGEPSSVEHIRIGEKGIFQARITVNTAGGHGAYSGLKTNAITDMVYILESLLSFENEAPEIDKEVRLFMERARTSYDRVLCEGAMDKALRPTLNIGTITGGIMVNMVPERCQAEIDFRFPPGVTCRFVEKWLDDKIRKHSNSDYKIIKSSDAHITSVEEPLVKIAKATACEVCAHPVFENYSLGGTEAVLWRAKGIPAITYGPNHHNMGSPDEYIMAEELPLVSKVHAMTAWRYLTYQNN